MKLLILLTKQYMSKYIKHVKILVITSWLLTHILAGTVKVHLSLYGKDSRLHLLVEGNASPALGE